MLVRPLTKDERFDAEMISHIAFHFRMENPEEVREKSKTASPEDWGAFDEDGRLMAHILNYRFESFLDGARIPNGGIGGVSTLPEYRQTGAVRAIFASLLPAAFRAGEVISTLYPFNHAFYRKFGYETVCMKNEYVFAPEVLSSYRFDGKAVQWQPGDPIAPWLELYHRFASGFNLAICRTGESFAKAHFGGKYYQDRKFAYLLLENGQPAAYVIFQDVRKEPAALLRVDDIAWIGRSGFCAVLGFLARFTADYGSICLPLPMGMELLNLIRSPKSYDIEKRTAQYYMLRVVNVQKLLQAMRRPADTRITVRTSDDLIPENNGTWLMDGREVARTDAAPDLTADIRALGQLAVGAVSLREAEYRPDVEVHAHREALSSVFVPKPLFVEHSF